MTRIRPFPGSKLLGLAVIVLLLLGCTSAPRVEPPGAAIIPAQRPVAEFVRPDGVYPIDVFDPWEPFNRRVYAFNAKFDQYIFLPVVGVYQSLPIFLQDRLHNVFQNFNDIGNLINAILQLKGEVAANTSSRIVWNTTIGILGLWDAATALGIPRQNEDFGQTLGHWGADPGPFLMLPILGPSSVRDGIGRLGDIGMYFYTHPVNFVDNFYVSTAYTGLYAIDVRSNLDFSLLPDGLTV